VYVQLVPTHRTFYLVGTADDLEDEMLTDISYVTSASLPSSVTNDRLLELLKLERRVDDLEERYDHARSFLPFACDPDDFPGPLSSKERRELQKRYEAALAEEAIVMDTYGKEFHEARDAAAALKQTLLDDIFGPVLPPSPDTLYFSFMDGYPPTFSIVGTYTELLHTAVALGERCDEKSLLRGLLSAEDFNVAGITNALFQRYMALWTRLSKEQSLSIQAEIPVPLDAELEPLVKEFNAIRLRILDAYMHGI
jgi:hypothetical protein